MALKSLFRLAAVLIACFTSECVAQSFPWTFTPETDVPEYLKFRAEGLSLKEASAHAVSYVRKWKDKKWTAPVEELAFFEGQRELQKYLRGLPGVRGVRLGMVGDIMWVRNQWSRFVAPEVVAHLSRLTCCWGTWRRRSRARWRCPR